MVWSIVDRIVKLNGNWLLEYYLHGLLGLNCYLMRLTKISHIKQSITSYQRFKVMMMWSVLNGNPVFSDNATISALILSIIGKSMFFNWKKELSELILIQPDKVSLYIYYSRFGFGFLKHLSDTLEKTSSENHLHFDTSSCHFITKRSIIF